PGGQQQAAAGEGGPPAPVAGHLAAQPAAEPVDERRVGQVGAAPAGAQPDRRPHRLGLLVGGADAPGPAVAEDGLHEARHPVLGPRAHHRSSSSATSAAFLSARYWSTRALPALTPISDAAWRTE